MKNLRQLLYDWFTYREDEVSCSHPFFQYDKLCATNGLRLIRIDKSLLSENVNLPMGVINKERQVPDTQRVIPECSRCTPLTKKTVKKAIQKAALVDEYVECGDCNGTGSVEYEYQSLLGYHYYQTHECPVCGGTGKLEFTGRKIHDPLQMYKMEEFFLTGNTLACILEVMNVLEVEQLFIRYLRNKVTLKNLMMLTLDQTSSVEVVIGGINDNDTKSIIKIPLEKH